MPNFHDQIKWIKSSPALFNVESRFTHQNVFECYFMLTLIWMSYGVYIYQIALSKTQSCKFIPATTIYISDDERYQETSVSLRCHGHWPPTERQMQIVHKKDCPLDSWQSPFPSAIMSSSEDKLFAEAARDLLLFYMSDIKYDPSRQSQLTVSSIQICRRS